MHEKKAREKEERLLEQEKQVYQARVRSEIRAKLANPEKPGSQKPEQNQPNYGPLSPEDHIKALADRFMKEGAEDLWNEFDGPVRTQVPKLPKSQVFGEPINLRKLILEKSCISGKKENGVGELSGKLSGFSRSKNFSTYTVSGSNLMGNRLIEYSKKVHTGIGLIYSYGIFLSTNKLINLRRYYTADVGSTIRSKRLNFASNNSLTSNDGAVSKEGSSGGRRVRWPRFRGNKMDSSDDDDTDDYDDEEEEMESRARRIVGSSAALGKYDMKTKKRVPLKFLEEENDLSQQVEAIREQFSKKSLEEDGGEKGEEESLLSSRRYVGFYI